MWLRWLIRPLIEHGWRIIKRLRPESTLLILAG